MKRLVVATMMTAVLGLTFSQSASAGPLGMRLNGLQLNGIILNGIILNGMRFNALAPEQAGGTTANPFSGLDGGALGQ